MNRLLSLLLTGVFIPSVSFAQDDREYQFDNTPAFSLEIDKFLGHWYEIARFDHRFERGISNARVTFTLNQNGTMNVIGTGYKNGKLKTGNGVARQPEPADNPALLRISFFWPFYSDCRVLLISHDYQYALMGSSDENSLWILSRTPKMNPIDEEYLLLEAIERGYDVSRLIWVDQGLSYCLGMAAVRL